MGCGSGYRVLKENVNSPSKKWFRKLWIFKVQLNYEDRGLPWKNIGCRLNQLMSHV